MAGALWTGYDPSFPVTGGGMKKRSKAGARPAKARPRKTLKSEPRSAPKAMPRRGSAPAGDAEVVNLVAGGKADLKTGAHVFIPRWEKQGDGTWQATVVVVGRDGITPPM